MSQSQPAEFSIVLGDIDHFKRINDRRGCDDPILCGIADTLKTLLPQEDMVARWGGEEFIPFLANADHEQALRVGERIRSSRFAAVANNNASLSP